MNKFPILAICILPIGQGALAGTILPPIGDATFAPGAPIDNPYFPILPGRTVVIEASGIDEDGETFSERSEISDIEGGPVIAGVEVQTQLDRAFEDGVLVEETYDYYAQDTDGNVWYFGEDVTNFVYDDEDNLVETDNDSAWRAGVDGASPGWIMPADPKLGTMPYYQEYAPANDALDLAQIFKVNQVLDTPLGSFAQVLVTYETNALDPDSREFKYYAPGIGLVRVEEDLDRALTNPELVFEITEMAPVPIPPALPALGAALLGLGFLHRRRAQ